METQTQKITVEIIDDDTIQLDIKDALRFPLIPELMRSMVNEFYSWYSQHYDYNIRVTLQRKVMGIIIEYDITRDVDFCIKACTRKAQENGLNPHDIGPSCAEGCLADFKKSIDFTFRVILSKLKQIVDRYSYSHKIYDNWDFTTKRIVFIIKL
jgi:hypothetical protein